MTPFSSFHSAILLLLAAGGPLCAADLNVLRTTIIDPSALNFSSAAATFSQNINGRTYQRSPMATFKGHQYATYYDSNRNVCLARRKLPAGPWEIIRFTDYSITSSDSHNVVALGICAADGTIHLAFDHHADPLNYRVSAPGVATDPEAVTWATSLFGPVTDKLGSLPRLTSVTYPSFFNAPNGNLMLYYRFQGSGSGDGMIQEYDGSTHDWTAGMGKFIARTGSYTGAISTNSTSRNPYINGISYGGNRLHASWCWRESAGGAQYNHDLNHAYSDDHGRTWHNSAGTPIGTTNSSFITINSPGLIAAAIPQNIGLSNQYTHHAYPDGSCHVIVQHRKSGTTDNFYHHYWRDALGTWSFEVLPISGSRPKLVGDDNRELFLAYVSGSTLRVAKGSPNSGRTAWTWSTIHSESGRSEGGEGQIDTSRWEAERILSLYGQVAPNSNGNPTALGVFDYQVSAKAILPSPLDGQSQLPLSPTLEWTAGIGASFHRIYLGTDKEAVASATSGSPESLGEQASTSFIPAAPLAPSTTYFWRVDEVDASAQVHQGLVWSFTTISDGPPTISTPSDQSVAAGSPVPEIAFTIGDDFTDPDTLILSSGSSNPALIPEGGIAFSGTGSALAAYLNAQYDGGNGIGDSVFLRLSTNAAIAGLERHFITSADAGGDNRPRISFTAVALRDFDRWLLGYSFPPGADLYATGDPDGDGVNTGTEYLFGMDPTDGNSLSPIREMLSRTNGTFRYSRRNPALTGADYQIWTSENLTDWDHDPTASQVPDDNNELQIVLVTLTDLPLTADAMFVQVRADP